MAIKVTLFFVSTGAQFGWTETYYSNSGSTAAALSYADASLRPARLGVLSSLHALRQIRVSDENVRRDSLIKAYTAAQGQGTFAVNANDPGDWGAGPETLPAFNALLLRMEASSAHRRMFLLRGIPLGAYGGDGIYNPGPLFVGLITAFSTAMTGGTPFQLRTQTAGSPQQITALTVLGGGVNWSMNFAGNPPAGFVPNAQIKVSGFLGAANFNGTWKIAFVSQPGGVGTLSTITTYPKRRFIIGTPSNIGFVSAVSIDFANITNVIPLRGVKKNTGRPFGLPRGRSRVRQS